MVYLVRTTQFLKFDESFEEEGKKLWEHLRNSYPQIKEMKFLFNVTGPINELHWLLKFDSLADEDEWATKVVRDEVYLNWMSAMEGVMTPGIDKLYREVDMLEI